MRAARGVGIDLLARHGFEELDELGPQGLLDRVVVVARGLGGRADRGRQVDLADGGHEGDDLNAVHRLQVLLRDSSRGNAP